MSEHITALNLVLNEVQPKFSSLLRRVSKILKFCLQNKFIQKGRQGDSSYEAVPLSPFRSPNPLARSRCMLQYFALHAVFVKFEQILKFKSEHITALNLVLNIVQPKFSSLLRRVSESLKFAKTA